MIAQKISSAANTQITATDTAQTLATILATNSESSAVIQAGVYMLCPEDGDIRILWDGNTPTTALGMILTQGQWLTLTAPSSKIKFMRDGSTNVKINFQAGSAIVGGRA